MEESRTIDISIDPSMVSYLQQPLNPGEDFAPERVDKILGSDWPKPLLDQRGIEQGNAEAVLNALQSLQDKIRGLELERARAADRFRALEQEAKEFRVNRLETKVSKQPMISRSQSDPKSCGCFHTLKDKLESTEAENLKLSAAQALTDSRVRELEDRLYESQKDTRVQRLKETMRGKRKKKRKFCNKHVDGPVVTVKTDIQTNSDGPEMPFVVAKSTTPTHSVTGNIQQTLAMMKRRNMPTPVPSFKKTVARHSYVRLLPPGEIKVVTTVKAEKGDPSERSRNKLELLKGVKRLQTALKHSDLRWE
eukprot:m.27960 g.27960  ORF g.27960 m.27960 type:complete len:307 (+) comp30506_c0_seq1:67-987(+)